jgi:GT2 family glycosyltransferase
MNFKVVILSARANNLVPCVRAIRVHEPDLPPENILVVDDGARLAAAPLLPGITWLPGVKPFAFPRNANLGLKAAGTDVVLLNDDACLVTPGGLSGMAKQVSQHPELGVCSAGIYGQVGNPNQLAIPAGRLRLETNTLAFVCVYIPWTTYQQIGPLDERFSGYGFDDNDYCNRVIQAGLRLGIWDGCVVDHSGRLPSTFRLRPEFQAQFQKNRRLYEAKWRGQGVAMRRTAGARPNAATRPVELTPVAALAPGAVRLNLGCCESAMDGFTNCDIFPAPGQETIDFRRSWPWVDNSTHFIRAADFIEHLPDKTFTMNELWRVLVPGGQVEITVPTTDGTGAFQDPTHISFWNRRSFLYFEAGNPYRDRFAHNYGIRARFRVLREKINMTGDGPQLNILLQAVKP